MQYYIWHGDTTGYLLFAELWDAAERGVRVRLLLDDNGIAGLDPTIAALDSHRNIEVRLFNPFVNRGFKALGYLTDFSRLNRRMHNKSFTADAQATIVGGRNVGDEYFGAGAADGVRGPRRAGCRAAIAGEVARPSICTGTAIRRTRRSSIVGKAAPDAVPAHASEVRRGARLSRGRRVRRGGARHAAGRRRCSRRSCRLEWAPVQLVYDDPTKTLGEAQDADLLFARLTQAIGKPEREIDLISPVFRAREGRHQGARCLRRARRPGAHPHQLAGGDRRRCGPCRVRQAPQAAPAQRRQDLRAQARRRRRPSVRSHHEGRQGRAAAAPSASLHAKTFSVDRSRVFVGSFNLDPRSVRLNTEMGLVIESPQLAAAISSGLDRTVDHAAYEVILGENGRLAG